MDPKYPNNDSSSPQFASHPSTGLLALPGGMYPPVYQCYCRLISAALELRNEIYASLYDSIHSEMLRTRRYMIRFRPVLSTRPTLSNRLPHYDWGLAYRQDLGITQSCRQLRFEYSSVYRKHYLMYISLRALIEYTDTLELH